MQTHNGDTHAQAAAGPVAMPANMPGGRLCACGASHGVAV